MVEAAGIEPASASPLPWALHAYSIYCFNRVLPDRQGTHTAIPKGFSALAPDLPQRDPVSDDA